MLSQVKLANFHCGGSEPEVVMTTSFVCFQRGLSVNTNYPRLTELNPINFHIQASKPEVVM